MTSSVHATFRAGETGNGRPLIAVSFAQESAYHPPWYSAWIARYARAAVAGLEAAGAAAVVLNPLAAGRDFSPEEYDGVLIMGGGDVDPARYGGNSGAPDLHCIDPAAELGLNQPGGRRGGDGGRCWESAGACTLSTLPSADR